MARAETDGQNREVPVTADPGETPAGTAGAGTTDLTLDATVAAADVPPAIAAQTLGQYFRASWARIRSGNSGVLPVVMAIVIVAVVFEIITPEHAFLRPSNLVYIFGLSTVYMILAIAETIVLLLAEVDLSVGAVALIGGAIAFKLVQQPGPNWPWWAAMLAALVICGAIGAVQGALTALLKIPSFVVTLGGFLLFSGLLIVLLGGADSTVSLNTSDPNQNFIYDMVQGLISPVIGWIVLALVLVTTPVVADQLDYSLYGGVEHSNNIGLSNTGAVSQWLLIPGFGFDYTQQGATLQASATGGAEYRDYLGGSYANQKFGELAGLVNWSVLPQRLDFVAQDYASVQPISTLSSNGPDNQQQTNVLTVGPTLYFNLGSALHGQAELRYINSRASRTTEFDSSRGDGALRLIRDVSPTSQLSLNLETQQVNFDDSDEPNYSRDEAFVRYVRKLAHLDLDVAAGWSHIDFDKGSGTASTPLVRIGVKWHASARNTFGISYTRDYSDAAQDLINLAEPTDEGSPLAPLTPFTPLTPPLSIQTGGAVIGSGVYLEQYLEGHYDYSGDRLTISLSPWYRKLHYLEGLQPDETGRGGELGVDYRLNPRLTLSGFANIEREDYTTLARRDTTTNVGLALRQFMNSHWSWRVSVIGQHRTSTAPGEGYQETEVYFGVVYQR